MLKYVVHAISKDRDNGNDGAHYLENVLITVWLRGDGSSPGDGKYI